MKKEYYQILEIEHTATEAEIKKAYRKKAMECHPDRCGGDKEKEAEFKKINEAYQTLSDSQKRAHYDQFGTSEGMGGGFSGFGGGFEGDIGDIFSQFFGGGFNGHTGQKRADMGEDIEVQIKLSLEDAIRGISRKISYEQHTLCTHCYGAGGETDTCTQCNGTGQIRKRMQTLFGVMEQNVACDTCNGSGEMISKACTHCHGKGKQSQKQNKTIDIPKGVENGMSMKMRGEGHAGRDSNGDLYITFIIPNEEGGLTREGANLHYTLRISPAEATIGIKKIISVPILGKKEISIKAGTQHHTEITFRGEGMDALGGHKRKGDFIVHISIEIPQRLNADQKKLYEALLKSEGKDTPKGWLEELFGK